MKYKLCFLLETIFAMGVFFFFIFADNNLIAPKFDYLHFIQMLPGKYINQEPYSTGEGFYQISKLSEIYRFHIKQHSCIDEIYACEASDSPCYIPVVVWIINKNLASCLIKEELNDEPLDGSCQFLASNAVVDEIKLVENQEVLLKSPLNTLNAKFIQAVSFSGFPQYKKRNTYDIFLVCSNFDLDKNKQEKFTISTEAADALEVFYIPDTVSDVENSINRFYVWYGVIVFALFLFYFITNWKILELNKYFAHLELLGANNDCRIKKKVLLVIHCLIPMVFVCTILFSFFIGRHDELLIIYLGTYAVSFLCFVLGVLIKR